MWGKMESLKQFDQRCSDSVGIFSQATINMTRGNGLKMNQEAGHHEEVLHWKHS